MLLRTVCVVKLIVKAGFNVGDKISRKTIPRLLHIENSMKRFKKPFKKFLFQKFEDLKKLQVLA